MNSTNILPLSKTTQICLNNLHTNLNSTISNLTESELHKLLLLLKENYYHSSGNSWVSDSIYD